MGLGTYLGAAACVIAIGAAPAGAAAVAAPPPTPLHRAAASVNTTFSRVVLTPGGDATVQYVTWSTPKALAGQQVVYWSGTGQARTAVAERLPSTSKSATGTKKPRYRATLTGLTPDTSYSYRITTATGQSQQRDFVTSPASDLQFLVLGDMQISNASVGRSVVQAGLAAAPDAELVVQTGDAVNRPDKDAQWRDLFTALGSGSATRTWLTAIGNHEQCVLIKCVSKGGQAFDSYWGRAPWDAAEQTWFTTDIGGVRFVVLDSFGGRVAEQADFLDRALRTNPNKWSVVVMHAGLYATRPGRTYPDLRETWGPIIESQKVDLVLSGHDHSYVRGIRTPGGPVYAGSVSGPKFYETSWNDWTTNGAQVLVNVPETPTYTTVSVSGDTLSVKVVAAGTPGPLGRPAGSVVDQYSIVHRNGAHILQ